MRGTPLPFSPPFIGEEEIAEVVDTLRSQWITTGPKVRRFEEEFTEVIGAPAALALSSCTAALHVALASLGIADGDAVITTPMTFCSGVHVIEQVGARPFLADVERDTLNINPENVRIVAKELEERGQRVRAIIPVHLYGHPYDRVALLEIAEQYGAAIIEDAAHALPARLDGRLIGANLPSKVPILTAFSFYATKNLTTAEGGMLTGPPALLREARMWSLHGMNGDAWKRYSSQGSWFYEVSRAGFKYNFTDLQAALGLQQLRKLPAFHARRTEIARRYTEAFAGVDEVQLPTEHSKVEHAWHIYSLRLNTEALSISRSQFIDELAARNIGSSVHFIPIHLHPYYRDKYGFQPCDFPVAYSEYQRLVSLPIYPKMQDGDVEDVIEAVYEIIGTYGRKL